MYYTPTKTCAVNYWLVPVMIRKEVNANDIIDAACEAFKITRIVLLSKHKKRETARARFICMYIMKKRLNISLKRIGNFFNRDHTTVIHALQTIKDDLSIPAYRQKTIEEIRAVNELL